MENVLRKAILALILFVAGSLRASAQGWTLDTGFNPGETLNTGHGPQGIVYGVHTLPGGKTLIGGKFISYNHQQHIGMVRLLPNGTPDPEFTTGDQGEPIRNFLVQPDGRILVIGDFYQWGGQVRHGIARLLSNGELDTTFSYWDGLEFGGPAIQGALCVALQSDGKIVVGGSFNAYDGVPGRNLVRLNADGSLDTAFHLGTGANGWVWAIAVGPDGQILIGGDFTSFNGVARQRIARLGPDGQLLGGDSPAGFNTTVNTLQATATGQFLVGGDFQLYGNIAVSHLVRLHADGSLDADFDPDIAALPVTSLHQMPDGRILVGCIGVELGEAIDCVVRLFGDGSRDSSFVPSDLFRKTFPFAAALACDENGSTWIGGDFEGLGTLGKRRLVRLTADGLADPTFAPALSADHDIYELVPATDGKIYLSGLFVGYNDHRSNGSCRLLANGVLDTTFALSPGPGYGTINGMVPLPDSGAIVYGSFMEMNGAPLQGIARLLPNGALDPTFGTNGSANGEVTHVAAYPDGRLLIIGGFSTYNGEPRNRIVRLLADGTVDPSFISAGPSNWMGYTISMYKVVLLPDDRIFVAGKFTGFSGAPSINLAVLEPDGSLSVDLAGQSGWGSDCSQSSTCQATGVLLLDNGKLMLWGYFSEYGGSMVNGLIRIDPDGTLDPTFSVGSGPDGFINSVKVREDGNLLVAGDFTVFDGVPADDLVLLSPTGSVLMTLAPGNGPGRSLPLGEAPTSTAHINDLLVLPNNGLLVSGSFTTFGGVPKRFIARLCEDCSTSAEEVWTTSMTVFPNPTHGPFSFALTDNANVRVLDIYGREVIGANAVGTSFGTLDLSHQPPGVYLVQLRYLNGSVGYSRIVKH